MSNIRELLASAETKRKKYNIKRSELCKRAGFTYVTYWRWIEGLTEPSGENILKLISTIQQFEGEYHAKELAKLRKPKKENPKR